MSKLAPRHIITPLLLIGGGILAVWLYQWELAQVEQHIRNVAEASRLAHQLRPVLLALLALVPGLAALYYLYAGILDRYIFRRFLSTFGIGIFAFLLIWVLLEIDNTRGPIKNADLSFTQRAGYYLVQFPYALSLLMPFVLLLSTLFTLGQLSASRELIGMTQTGRGFLRIIRPIIVISLFASLVMGIFNYHWNAAGLAHKEGMEDAAQYETFTRARSLIYHDSSSERLWYIGLFPTEAFQGTPLRNVEITTPGLGDLPTQRLRADSASWDQETGVWTLTGAHSIQLTGSVAPSYTDSADPLIIADWSETPAQILAAGLPADTLGIPELQDWLRTNPNSPWIARQPYIAQLHCHLSSPATCLLAIMLAAPMAITFSRRATTSGVLTALVLFLLLFFANEIFRTMGSNGHLPPLVSAWLGNTCFALLGAVLIYRRVGAQPIVQSVKAWMTR